MLFKILHKLSEYVCWLLVPPYFWANRWVNHNKFLLATRSSGLGGANPLALPFVLIVVGLKRFKTVFQLSFADYALSRYQVFITSHYSEGGFAHKKLVGLSAEEKRERYMRGVSRLRVYVEQNPEIVNFQDGDCFLDLGCGSGQNIRYLSDTYPNSEILGFDFNRALIDIIQSAERNPNVKVEVGSFVDMDYLHSYSDDCVDWAIMSYTMGFIASDSAESTIELRKNIVNQCARISRKGVLVLTRAPEPGFQVEIENNTRCFIRTDYGRFFEDLSEGEFCALRSEYGWAYCWLNRS